MSTLFKDLQLAWRLMRKSPGFTLAVVLTLGLAIGSTTAIFTVVDATLVRGLPYPEPRRLVQVTMTKTGTTDVGMEASYPTFLDWKAQTRSFEYLAGYGGGGGVAQFGAEAPRLVQSVAVTADFFRTFGVTPALGSDFRAGDEDPADKQVAILSNALWQRQFGGDTGVVGTTFTFNGAPCTIIGVLPAGFTFAPIAPAEIYTPVERLPFQMRRNLHWLNVVGRLQPDVRAGEAESELALVSERLAQAYPESNRDTGARLTPLREAVLGDLEPIMLLLLSAVGLLLLIACVNVANLMLARAASRQRELAVRVALGASRARLVRQTLTEAVALAMAGAAAGVIFALWIVSALLAAIPETVLRFMPYLSNVQLDGRALAFTVATAVLTGILFGLAPAVQLTRPNPQEALSDQGRTTAGGGRHRVRAALVAAQVALAVVLLAGAVLTTRSLLRMLEQDPGFETRGLATLRILLPQERYPDADRGVPALREIKARLGALPGAEGVGITNRAPFQAGNTVRFRHEHEPATSAGEQAEASIRSVDPSYFAVLKARLLRGRPFDGRDEGEAPPTIIVNRTLAERQFGGQDPIGRRLVFTFAPDQPAREIVGVIDDVREGPLDAAADPAIYTPLLRTGARVVDIMIRTSGEPSTLLAAAEHAVKGFDPAILLMRKATMRTLVDDSSWVFFRRYPATLISVFAGSALLLAAIGLFGMVSYAASQRTREIGVRMALGARPGDVFRLMMGHGLRPALAGVALGLTVALGLARVVESLLFGVSTRDPLTFVVVPLALVALAALATSVPARRAMKLDPVSAIRQE